MFNSTTFWFDVLIVLTCDSDDFDSDADEPGTSCMEFDYEGKSCPFLDYFYFGEFSL